MIDAEDHATDADDERPTKAQSRSRSKLARDASVTPQYVLSSRVAKQRNNAHESRGDLQPVKESADTFQNLVRRAVEIILVIFASYLTLRGLRANRLTDIDTRLIHFFGALSGCCVLLPLLNGLQSHHQRSSPGPLKYYTLELNCDPGTYLYPVLFPFLIASSVQAGMHIDCITPNLFLSIASFPAYNTQLTDLKWVLCLTQLPRAWSNQVRECYSPLFVLHSTLSTLLYDLVDMSLEPSEISLLSSGLMNLLVLAKSATSIDATPAIAILASILWIGGLCCSIVCEKALKWELAASQIPMLRLAKNRTTTKGLTGVLNRLLQRIWPERRSTVKRSRPSDSEDNSDVISVATLKHNSRPDSSRPVTRKEYPVHKSATTQRRYGHLRSFWPEAVVSTRRWCEGLLHLFSSPNPFVGSTFPQLQAIKYTLALYVYSALIVIILWPIRKTIANQALGHEPFGWALGYLFGNIQQFRIFVVSNNLEGWIKLPRHRTHYTEIGSQSWVEVYRQKQLGTANTRLYLALYCIACVSTGIFTVLKLRKVVNVDTRRKVFHFVMVFMLLPTIPIDPSFLALALVVVLAIFMLLDLLRACQVPPISQPLTDFLAPYVDSRDHRGSVTVSPIFLLIGCAIPLWLTLTSLPKAGEGMMQNWEVVGRDASMMSGVICVGMGDAAASLVGRRYGRTKWYWGGRKSIEGSAAFAIAVTAGLTCSRLWLHIGGWTQTCLSELPVVIFKSTLAGITASMLETVLAAANDNVVVPIYLWLVVRSLDL